MSKLFLNLHNPEISRKNILIDWLFYIEVINEYYLIECLWNVSKYLFFVDIIYTSIDVQKVNISTILSVIFMNSDMFMESLALTIQARQTLYNFTSIIKIRFM